MHGSNSTQREHTGNPVNNQQHFFWRVFFFMSTGVGMGEVKSGSMEPLCDPHVLVGKSARSQLARPNDWCCRSVERRQIAFSSAGVWRSAAECRSVFGPRYPEEVLKQLTGLLKTRRPPNTSALIWESLGNVLLTRCSHTGFEEKWHLILYNVTILTLNITCFYKSMVSFYFNTLIYLTIY